MQEDNSVQNRFTDDELVDLIQHTFASAGEGCSVEDAERIIATWQQHA